MIYYVLFLCSMPYTAVCVTRLLFITPPVECTTPGDICLEPQMPTMGGVVNTVVYIRVDGVVALSQYVNRSLAELLR